MIDVYDIPLPGNGRRSIFFSQGPTPDGIQVWEKPSNVTMIYMTAIGAGGAGGSGFSSAVSTSRCGGGGGGSGGICSILVAANRLPDRLYVIVGDAKDATASNGGTTVVSISPELTNNNRESYLPMHVIVGAGGGGRGGNGTATSRGGAGTASVGFGKGTSSFSGPQSIVSAITGQNGSTGGNINTGTDLTYPATGILLSGGTGGGGNAGYRGGNLNVPASQNSANIIIPSLDGGSPGLFGTRAGGRGLDGFARFDFLAFTGGTGGGSSYDDTASGGDGGVGAIGCGGGGGGAGNPGGTGGLGGNGLVIITCW
jgi:hypothetical protein